MEASEKAKPKKLSLGIGSPDGILLKHRSLENVPDLLSCLHAYLDLWSGPSLDGSSLKSVRVHVWAEWEMNTSSSPWR